MSTTTDRYLSYPALAAGVSVAMVATAAWNRLAYVQVVPASTITADCYIAGITWCWPTALAANDTTYDYVIQLASGSAGSEVLFAQIPVTVRRDTNVGYINTNNYMFPEPKYLAANTRLAVSGSYSAAAAVTLSGFKIIYKTP